MKSIISDKKVLVVDDEASIREVLSRYFRRRGFQVILSGTGNEAISLFKEHQPHIVLLDILLPGMNGIQVLSELKSISSSVKVIIISAVKNEEVFKECRTYGVMDYIIKPFDFLDLDTRLNGKLPR